MGDLVDKVENINEDPDWVKLKKRFILGVVAMNLTIIVLFPIFWSIERGKLNNRKPRYGYHINSSSIVFKDDFALGMKAYAIVNGKRIEMKNSYKRELSSDDTCQFDIPKEALAAKEFTVKAIDVHGYESDPMTLNTYRGSVTEKNAYSTKFK